MGRKPTKTAFWERGYLSHGYWLGKDKLGEVRLAAKDEWDGVYRWQAGKRQGEAKTLEQARRAVENTVELSDTQLGLFDE